MVREMLPLVALLPLLILMWVERRKYHRAFLTTRIHLSDLLGFQINFVPFFLCMADSHYVSGHTPRPYLSVFNICFY